MTFYKFAFTGLLIFLCSYYTFAQDSLLRIDLAKHVYHFDIQDQQFVGDGTDFIKKEAAENQYFLLGEFHDSPGISKFTQALIPILAQEGFHTFGLEIGPNATEILTELCQDTEKVQQNLYDFHTKYGFIEDDGYFNAAFPFFDYKEDADFIAEAAKKNWDLIGLDQEYYYGYLPLMDRMFDQLTPEQQKPLKELYLQSRDSILYYYKLDEHEGKRLALSIRDSKTIHSFLTKASKANNKNIKIAKAIETTIEIYGYNATRQYLKANSTRIDYMKENLKKGFDAIDFDLSKDKMLLKMGGIHTARGFSYLSLFELGNTLSELADYHGNKSIHINFGSRYYMEDGQLIDELADEEGYSYKFVDYLQFAKKDQWTIIDLRPIKERLFYFRKYKVDDLVKDFFEKHDVIIIPKLDGEGSINYGN